MVPAAVRAAGAQMPAIEPGFVSLFDGQTLAGWSVQDGPASAFRVADGAIAVDPGANFPTWLRSEKQYENFDFRCEFFLKGWMNSGLYLHAPEHGRNTWVGMKINIFHQADREPRPESVGSIFPLIAPLAVNVRNQGEWNTMRVLMDWPRLQVWMNDALVQDLDVETVSELRHRLRRGYLGFESLSYPIRFRHMRIRELPSKETWQALYEGPEDFAKWQVASGKPIFEARGPILRGDGDGQLATRETYRDFLLQLLVQGSRCLVRINGDTVMEYDGLQNLEAGHIELQAHDAGKWIEYKQIRIRRL